MKASGTVRPTVRMPWLRSTSVWFRPPSPTKPPPVKTAVVARPRRVGRPQAAPQPLALAGVQRHAFVIVERGVAQVAHRELAQRRQAVRHGGDGAAGLG